ncbi:hypothetical protein PLESTB_001151600 [Pleodorina starrii]|uniref:Uncharacterized protein n=1 Tax=Pleodorina starrii TaxID=330485 RepID=A0A9W6BSQ0_9CHLO|nr:hypothetical protein PLESTM_001784000 [Pleodorina starrii]GLC56811.1 hypothetical protein PLESTB_001151600 [Pleodorina starrii]GLC68147.1 hypothetical protein PLESTF_000653500 [Pleodorina starrii]
MQVAQFKLSARLRRIAPPMAPATTTISPLLGVAARSCGPARRLSLAVQAAKGFGKPKPTPARPAEDDAAAARGGGRKGKAKRVQLQPGSVGPIPNQQRPGGPQDPSLAQFQTALLAPEVQSEEEEEFNARLLALKAQGSERAAAAAAAAAAGAAGAAAAAATPAVFDAPPSAAPGAADGGGNIYANPPPLSQTLLTAAGGGAAASDISDPKLRDANIGPSQLGLAAGAIVFIAIFLIVAAGDYAPSSRRYSGVRPAQAPPDPIEEKILKGKISLYEEQIKADPNNDDATEALATSYAKLMQYDKAAELLDKLSKRSPNDAEVWRLLGESSLLSQQPRKAVPAFERAVELRRQQQPPGPGAVLQPDLQLLTGLVDAYIANNDSAKAIEALRGVREMLRESAQQQQQVQQVAVVPEVRQEEAAAEPASASTAEPAMLTAPPLTDEAGGEAATSSQPVAAAPAAAADAAAAAASSSSSSAAASAPGAAIRPLDPVGVELLTAKVYAAWRGHDQDALATYDELIKTFPEDYRGYLAKGVFLKEKGRKADAERMFLQARFFAPASKQQLVRAIADATPAAPQLPDNN